MSVSEEPTVPALLEELRKMKAGWNQQAHFFIVDTLRDSKTIRELTFEVSRLKILSESLYDAIKHGDDVHQAWLKDAIDKHFAQKP